MIKFPPHPAGAVPILGNVPDFMKGPLGYFEKNEKIYPDIFWLKSPFRKVCVVYKPEYIRHILQENHRSFKKSFAYDALKPILGEGLLTSEGDFWIRQRRLSQPAFHKERIAGLIDIMAECVQEVMKEWGEKYKEGELADITFEMNRLALLIVSRTLFRAEITEEDINKLNQALAIAIEAGAEKVRNPFKLPLWIPTPQNQREKASIKTIHSLIGRIIDKRIADTRQHNDLLDMLVHARDEETGEGMSRQQLMDEVVTLFIAGHETTANALNFTWYLLAQNPDADQKLIDEIHEKLGYRTPTAADMHQLPYTRQIIDEALRLYPPAWIIAREAKTEITLGEYTLPAGTAFALPVYVVHRSLRNWNDPEKFIPERFSEEHARDIQKFAYFPFGGGPRLCIGNMFALYEMMIVITMIRRRYKMQLPDNYKLEIDPLVTLRTKQPICMQLVQAEEVVMGLLNIK